VSEHLYISIKRHHIIKPTNNAIKGIVSNHLNKIKFYFLFNFIFKRIMKITLLLLFIIFLVNCKKFQGQPNVFKFYEFGIKTSNSIDNMFNLVYEIWERNTPGQKYCQDGEIIHAGNKFTNYEDYTERCYIMNVPMNLTKTIDINQSFFNCRIDTVYKCENGNFQDINTNGLNIYRNISKKKYENFYNVLKSAIMDVLLEYDKINSKMI